MTRLSQYVRAKGRPIRARFKVGKRDSLLSCEVTDNYVRLHLTSPGEVKFVQEIYIPRSTWVKLLKWAIPLTKEMQGPDFYVPDAAHEYHEKEQLWLEEYRKMKKARRGTAKRRRRTRSS